MTSKSIAGVVVATILILPVLTGVNLRQAAAEEATVPMPGVRSVGTVDWLDSSSQLIVVDDRQFMLSPNVRARLVDQRPISIAELRKGSRISFIFDQSGGQMIVTDVWLETK